MKEFLLRHHSRVYFDRLGQEFREISNDEKLEELSELIKNGFDLYSEVKRYKKDRSPI